MSKVLTKNEELGTTRRICRGESCREVSVFEERTSQFMVENTPAQCSPPNLSSLSSLTIDEEVKPSQLDAKLSEESSKIDLEESSHAPQALPARTLVSEPLRAKEAWDALSSAYEDKGLGRRISLERKLYRYCLDDFDFNIETYINAVMSTVQDLADIGKIMEDASIAAILLGGLSAQYAPLVMALENSNIDITVDLIKTKLLNELNKPAIDNPGDVILHGSICGGLYSLDCTVNPTTQLSAFETHSDVSSFKLWHRRLGHLCRIGMDQLRKGHAVGVDYSEVDKEPCIPCIEAEVKNKFRIFQSTVERETGAKIKILKSDNGKEYVNAEFSRYLQNEGIQHQTTVPYSPQQNSIAERTNRSILEKVRSMLSDSSLSPAYWQDAAEMAVYLKNRSPHRALNGKTAYEKWYAKIPNLSHLRVFGCRAFIHVPECNRKKLDMKASEHIFVGYSEDPRSYFFRDIRYPRRLVKSRDVTFFECDFQDLKVKTTCKSDNNLTESAVVPLLLSSQVNSSNSSDSRTPVTSAVIENEQIQPDIVDIISEDVQSDINVVGQWHNAVTPNVSVQPVIASSSEETESDTDSVEPRYNLRPRKPNSAANCVCMQTSSPQLMDEPTTYTQALNAEDSDKWYQAMQDEYQSLLEKQTWVLVDRPDKKVIPCKWIYKLKKNAHGDVIKYKARLVAKGFNQVYGIDYLETFSPVVRNSSLRMLFALAAEEGMKMHHLDVDTAFLNGILEEEVYMSQPEGFIKPGQEDKVCLLKRSLYGLKQASRAWKDGGCLIGYADADWANCPMDRRSYTEFYFSMAGGAISWESKKQTTIALLSSEAEYMSLSSAGREAEFLRRLMCELTGTQTPGDTCQVYFTEDTPAILSKAGSNSNLSALSIESAAPASDSSGLSDHGDLLRECIQKGIDKVVKNKGAPSDVSPINTYADRDEFCRSLPPYLRASTETVKMSHEFNRNVRDSRSASSERGACVESSPPPPLPPKDTRNAAPPRPPPHEAQGRRHESRLPVKLQRNSRDKPQPAPAAPRDSSSSLSLDSFGSTDREIFEETVQAGLSSVNPRANYNLDKAHSVERPTEHTRHPRNHKSLDRSDKINQHRPKIKDPDPEFEKNIASGVYNVKNSNRIRKLEQDYTSHSLTRSPYSYHGEGSGIPSRFRAHSSRYYDDGPPSLPARIDEPRRQLERSNSLSSLSNDSFGSTDKEVFERCVRMGMSKAQKKQEKLRVRSDDRLEARDHRSRRKKDAKSQGALDKMVGEDSRDRAILEEVIARGAGGNTSKNAAAPPPGRAPAGGANTNTPGSDAAHTLTHTHTHTHSTDTSEINRSNECLAPRSTNTTIDSEVKDELDRSNESYADVLDGSWSDDAVKNYDAGTLTRRKLEWTDIKYTEKHEESRHDTWNDNTCPDDVTFPTISGSVHMVSSLRSEIADPALALPDLLEKSETVMSCSRPDLTNKLEDPTISDLHITESNLVNDVLLDNIPEPSFTSLVDDGEQKFDSLMASAIEKEAARLAAQLKSSAYAMENSVTSLTSLDLDNVKPPSHLGSLLSLSASGQWDDSQSKRTQKPRKKSLPVAMMVKRALTNSMHQGSSEHLDSNPVSFLDNVKPPSEMENIDLESSMISVCSIVSEVADREKTPVVFDFRQPIQDFPLCHNFNMLDLDKVNPPSLFDEMAESTVEIEQTTAHQLYDDTSNTLNVVTDIPSGSENCTPLPSDVSSVESTPKRQRDPKYLTPKEKRSAAKDRYQTYTIIDPSSESDVVLQVESEEFVTWTKSESDRSDEYVTANSEAKSKRKMSAKQRRLEDRARYQTQTVNIHSIIQETKTVDPQIESLKQRLAAKKTIRQKRLEDAERFRTRTLSEDIPPSPTFVTKDANFENVETTTGYDSLSSNELSHQQIIDERQDDVFRETDSGHTEDDFELNSTQMQTYTKSFRNYLPVIESPAAVDICVVNNLKNIEMTASYRRALESDKLQNPSSSDFASYEGDSNSDKVQSDSEEDEPPRPKPKITKPERRDDSLDSNDSHEKEEAKTIRGRKKAAYVSPYRRSVPPAKKPTPTSKAPVKPPAKPLATPKAQTSAKASSKPPTASKPPSANTSPKKTLNKSPSKTAQQKTVAIPLVAGKPLPLERQGTFTKEESSVPAKDLPVPDKKPAVSRYAKTPPKSAANNTSPSRLPQLNRYTRPPLKKSGSGDKPPPKNTKPTMRNSASNHSLHSNDSAKTVTLASRGSRQGSTSSVNSVQSSKISAKDVESKIANLWKKVEQSKKVTAKPDKRVWIESDKTETPKLIRSSTFEGQPKQTVPTAPKQKTAIGIKVSQIPSLRPKSTPSKISAPTVKKPALSRVFTRKPANGQAT
ncbi:hypothetical protein MSG28_008301 [Choristoneura fumiferana]|uniref:Uncharacterized protein n=1 Tax=Choristoneura fumiferana TaxID=7141 RepID=A0ACC0JB48_CHOFU|nr:hypothetical protein MSG28_008301 [Choristoneura fumiferana]